MADLHRERMVDDDGNIRYYNSTPLQILGVTKRPGHQLTPALADGGRASHAGHIQEFMSEFRGYATLCNLDREAIVGTAGIHRYCMYHLTIISSWHEKAWVPASVRAALLGHAFEITCVWSIHARVLPSNPVLVVTFSLVTFSSLYLSKRLIFPPCFTFVRAMCGRPNECE